MNTFGRLFSLPIFFATAFVAALTLGSILVFAEPVWIDVRTESEYTQNHIEGDTTIPMANIDPLQLAKQFGKDAEINLCCQSGVRAGRAKEILEAAGFINVNNVGGIDGVRDLRELARSSSVQ